MLSKSLQVDLDLLKMLYKDCMCNFKADLVKVDLEEFQELFLWTVISNLSDVMDLLWSYGEDYLRKALIGEYASNMMVKIGEKHKRADDTISKYKYSEK